jgi:DNA polymerase-1
VTLACCAAFRSGQDIHRATAAEVFGVALAEVDGNQRRAAKAINFGLMYGMSAFGLARQLGIGRGEAQDYIAPLFQPLSRRGTSWTASRQQARTATVTSRPCSAGACI